jgi:hypothetical protein
MLVVEDLLRGVDTEVGGELDGLAGVGLSKASTPDSPSLVSVVWQF